MSRIGVAEIVHLCCRQSRIIVVPLLATFAMLSSWETAESQERRLSQPAIARGTARGRSRIADDARREGRADDRASGNGRRRCCSMSRATSIWRRPASNFGHGHGLGQVGRPSDAGGGKNARQMAELTNAIQKFFVEESRLGIPVIFHEECLHGHAAVDATSFPQPIGLGGTFDPDLVERHLHDDGGRGPRRAARIRRSRRWSTWPATRAGAVSRKRTAKIRTSWPSWASPRCKVFRATARSATSSTSSPRSSISPRTASRNRATTAPR